jgi:hypothetical protein
MPNLTPPEHSSFDALPGKAAGHDISDALASTAIATVVAVWAPGRQGAGKPAGSVDPGHGGYPAMRV